jgi:hypothetical protein
VKQIDQNDFEQEAARSEQTVLLDF